MVGMVFFIILYSAAAIDYSGGSYKMPTANHFNFWHNYLCDLLDKKTYNGLANSSRYYAQAALATLCFSLMIIWFYVPLLFSLKSFHSRIIQITGILSMTTILFLSSERHDLIIRIAGILGLVAITVLVKALIDFKYYKLAVGGCFCILIFLLNYIIYESGLYIKALPVIQKFTFVSFMGWFCLIDIALYLYVYKKNIRKKLN